MYARTTLFEIDTVRIPLDQAERLFMEQVLPQLRHQPGYRGVVVMRTPEGKGMVLTLWADQEAARAGVESGYYQEQVAKFVTFMRQPPGREHYEVVHTELTPEAAV
ncbi:MAG TPA: antibiotic biosynthesis monooxygenase [Dehalococcoidia bacterium]